MRLRSHAPGFLLTLALLVTGAAALRATRTPRTGKHYVLEQSRMPRLHLSGDSVFIDDVRTFRYEPGGKVEPGWRSAAYDLSQVRAAWYVLSPFASWRGPAHAFLSFEFSDSTFLAVSVEARREVGEEYSPLRGALRQYELIYVIGDETDLIRLRSNVWQDPVYLYPTVATPPQARALLQELLGRAAALAYHPEYYNTITNNCATSLADALNVMAPHRARWSPALVLPGYSDRYAWRRGLLALQGDPDLVREHYRVNQRAQRADTADFSRRIRSPTP